MDDVPEQPMHIVDVSRRGSGIRETEMELPDSLRSSLTVDRDRLERATGLRRSKVQESPFLEHFNRFLRSCGPAIALYQRFRRL